MGLTRKRILPEEEQRMWLWIYKNLKDDNKDAYLSCGFQIWNQYIEHYGIKDRTADSYATRFRKIMKPAIITSQLKPSQIHFIIEKCKWNIIPSQQKLLEKMIEDEKAFEDGDVSGYVDESNTTLPPTEKADDSILGNQNTPTTSKMLEKDAKVVKIEPSSTRPSRRCSNPFQNYNEKFLSRSSRDAVISPGPLITPPQKMNDDEKACKDGDISGYVEELNVTLPTKEEANDSILGNQNTPTTSKMLENCDDVAVKKESSSSTRPSRRCINPSQNYNVQFLSRRSREAVIPPGPLITPFANISNNNIVIKKENDIDEPVKKSQKRRAQLSNKPVKKRIISDENDIPKPVSVEVKQEVSTEIAENNNVAEADELSVAKETTPDINMISTYEHQIIAEKEQPMEEDLTSTLPSYLSVNEKLIAEQQQHPMDHEDLTSTFPLNISVNENEEAIPNSETPALASLEGEKENLPVISSGDTVAEGNALPVTKESIPLNENMILSPSEAQDIIPNISEPQNIASGWDASDDEDLTSKLTSNICANEVKEKELNVEAPKAASVETEVQEESTTEVTNNSTVAEDNTSPVTKEILPSNQYIISNVSEPQNIAGGWDASDDENLTPKLTSNISSNVDKENLPYPEAPKSISDSSADTTKESNMLQSSDIEMSESNDTSMNDKVETAANAGTSESVLTENSIVNEKATPLKIDAPITPDKNISVLTPKSILYSGQRKSKDDGSAMRVRFQSPEKSAETNNLTPKRTAINTPEFTDIDNEILQLLWHKVHGDNVSDISPTDLAAFKKISLFKDLHMRIKNVQSFFRGRKPTPSNTSSSSSING